jgi:hypothetical protein
MYDKLVELKQTLDNQSAQADFSFQSVIGCSVQGGNFKYYIK